MTRTREDRDAPLFNAQCHQEGGNVRQGWHLPAKSSTPLSKASEDITLISLKFYSPTSWYQLTNCASRISELMTKDSRIKESPSWTVRQFWTSAGTPKHAERASCVIAMRALFETSPLWQACGLPECYSDDLTAIVQFLCNEGEVRPLSAPLAFGENVALREGSHRPQCTPHQAGVQFAIDCVTAPALVWSTQGQGS